MYLHCTEQSHTEPLFSAHFVWASQSCFCHCQWPANATVGMWHRGQAIGWTRSLTSGVKVGSAPQDRHSAHIGTLTHAVVSQAKQPHKRTQCYNTPLRQTIHTHFIRTRVANMYVCSSHPNCPREGRLGLVQDLVHIVGFDGGSLEEVLWGA